MWGKLFAVSEILSLSLNDSIWHLTLGMAKGLFDAEMLSFPWSPYSSVM